MCVRGVCVRVCVLVAYRHVKLYFSVFFCSSGQLYYQASKQERRHKELWL